MNTNRQVLWNNDPAPAARLGGVERIHSDDLNTGALSLVFKHLTEESKPSVVRGQGKMSIAVHKPEGKILDRNQVILSNQPATDFVQIIRSLIGNFFVQTGNLAIGSPLPSAALDLPGCVALQAAQTGQILSQPTRVLDQLTSRQCGETLQPYVDSNLLTGLDYSRHWIVQIDHQTGVPALPRPLDDSMLEMCSVGDRPVIAHAYFTHILHVKAHAPVLILSQLAPVAVGVFDAVKAVATFETRKPRLFPCFQAAKERAKALSRRRSTCCRPEAFNRPKVSGLALRTSRKYSHCAP